MTNLAEENVRNMLERVGQEHLLQPSPPRERLQGFLHELQALDFEKLRSIFVSSMTSAAAATPRAVAPFPDVTFLEDLPNAGAMKARGLELIAAGKVAALLLAGGQGTRLGSNAPKGCYDIGMPSHKSLFQYHAEKIISVKRLAAAHVGANESSVRLPFLVLTSSSTDAETRSFWASNNYFGLPAEQVIFFEQGMLPCFTLDGRIILEAPAQIATAPNGNGGVYIALQQLGLLEQLEKDGVTSIFQFGVDNVLCHVAEPTFVGFCEANGAECGVKTIGKKDPHEKVGVLALSGGAPSVVEYSEISREMAEARTSSGELLYGSAHICVNWFSLAFLRRFCSSLLDTLPLHVARKKIPYCMADGTIVQPSEINGVKLELFIFDTFPHAAKLVALQVPRELEFAPVKNAPGSATESPDTARQLFSNLCHNRLLAAGGSISQSQPQGSGLIEISPSSHMLERASARS
eukprot:CAMPEP_0119306368 /NCGR_PEP_ID=MMETSP1333-20130426/7150_1 /TAXON_ID=418940 /ORGANISM="Scyphosphaera apsteinii, Strain RCC1455" /LENGTH=462 /DNA_ID=CAMNT_0007309649 /DNA_START=116 /DNA_END=1505 /DNA_ORIENTATION=-